MYNYVASSIQCIYAVMERDRVVLNVPRQKQKGETKAQELSWPLSLTSFLRKLIFSITHTPS